MAGSNDIEVLEKRLLESRLYDMNFGPKMADDETIVSITSLTSTPTTAVAPLTMGSPAISGKRIQFRLSGGVDGGKYYQVGLVLTNLGNTIQSEGYLLVREPS